MLKQEFDACVVDGQLVPADALRAFEGHQVHVTIAVPPVFASPSRDAPENAAPEDLDVEKDVYVAMPFPETVMQEPIIVDGGRLKPCLIFPEDVEDEKNLFGNTVRHDCSCQSAG